MRDKEVINICDGKRLGCVMDLEFDACSGKIEKIIIPGPGKICGVFGNGQRIRDSVRLYQKNRPGHHPGRNPGGKVFAEILSVAPATAYVHVTSASRGKTGGVWPD